MLTILILGLQILIMIAEVQALTIPTDVQVTNTNPKTIQQIVSQFPMAQRKKYIILTTHLHLTAIQKMITIYLMMKNHLSPKMNTLN